MNKLIQKIERHFPNLQWLLRTNYDARGKYFAHLYAVDDIGYHNGVTYKAFGDTAEIVLADVFAQAYHDNNAPEFVIIDSPSSRYRGQAGIIIAHTTSGRAVIKLGPDGPTTATKFYRRPTPAEITAINREKLGV